jgi:hypothetical protein
MLISVDPGLRACGVAAWNAATKSLVHAGFVINQGTGWVSMVDAVRFAVGLISPAAVATANVQLAIEIPQVYGRALWKGDPNDLIDLAGLVGAFVHCFPEGRVYRPAEWKKQVTKEVTEHRAKKRLTEEELSRVVLPSAKGLRHNVWDAVGIGLHHLERH